MKKCSGFCLSCGFFREKQRFCPHEMKKKARFFILCGMQLSFCLLQTHFCSIECMERPLQPFCGLFPAENTGFRDTECIDEHAGTFCGIPTRQTACFHSFYGLTAQERSFVAGLERAQKKRPRGGRGRCVYASGLAGLALCSLPITLRGGCWRGVKAGLLQGWSAQSSRGQCPLRLSCWG